MPRTPNAVITQSTATTSTILKENVVGFVNQHLVDFGIIVSAIIIGILLGKKFTRWIFGTS